MAERYTLKGPGLQGAGFDVVEEAARNIDRYDMLAGAGGGESLVVAVSGGPDSTCLLDVLARLRASFGFDIVVAHVDHGLSPGSEEIAAKVAALTAEAGFEAHVVRAPDLAGSNLHARAREFRYGFFDLVATRAGADRIATGHTLDDRAETTLARLIHGAGTEGLAGLRPVDNSRIRPLISLRRSRTRAYCIERNLSFFDDPGNADLRFERSRVRSEVLPAIERGWGEGAIASIATSAERLGEDASLIASLADSLFMQLAKTEGDLRTFELATFGQVPRAMQRRLLERAVGRLRDRSGAISSALEALARGATDVRFDLPSGGEIAITRGRVEVRAGASGETQQ